MTTRKTAKMILDRIPENPISKKEWKSIEMADERRAERKAMPEKPKDPPEQECNWRLALLKQ